MTQKTAMFTAALGPTSGSVPLKVTKENVKPPNEKEYEKSNVKSVGKGRQEILSKMNLLQDSDLWWKSVKAHKGNMQ